MTRIRSITQHGGWARALDAARLTVNKAPLCKEPSNEWKMAMLRAQHSPIRLVEYDIVWDDMPSWVATHLVRHHIGCEKFVGTQRDDRTESAVPRAEKPQGAPVTMMMSANAQAIINISEKRLCNMASRETREAWTLAVDELRTVDPELAFFCVPQCVRLGHCPEMKGCGYVGTDYYRMRREYYLGNCIEGGR